MKKETYVISLGGSLIVPNEIDINFLKGFRKLLLKQIARGHKFVIICGGGMTARNYQTAAGKITKLNETDLDWLGIHGTRINGHLLRTIFNEVAHKKLLKPGERVDFKEKIVIGAGWKPGRSTDYCAVMLAQQFGAEKIINLSNIKYAYDKDPKKNKDAKPIIECSWKEFRKILPKKWSPGLCSPFDPVASKLAQKLEMQVTIMNGKDLKNLDRYFQDKNFAGTTIKD